MKTKQTIVCGLIAAMLALAFTALSLTGCEQPNDPKPTIITYTATQTGGTDGTADTTGILFTFSESVDGLTAGDITVGGTAAKGSGVVTGSGTSWTLPITVNAAGAATVKITKEGIETGTKNVTVYKAGQTAPEYWSITWNLNGGAEGTGEYPAQIEKGEPLDKPSPDPIKADNTFGGWYADSGLTQAYNFANPVTADLTLYAKWEAGSQPPVPTHTHEWGEWTATTIEGTEQRVCGTDQSHIEHRLTGTDRFRFEPILEDEFDYGSDILMWRIRKGAVTTGEIYIPAYWRPDADFDFLPVTEIDKASYFDIDDMDGWLNGAFQNTSFTAVHIPASVTSIGRDAFSGCSSLASITISGATSIGAQAFYDCTSLTSITIPGVTSIDVWAFYGCTSLTSITIPASVTSIDVAFSRCSNLTSITVDANNPNYAGEGGVLYNKAKTTLIAYPSASGAVTIAAGVTSIGSEPFYSSSLTSITIPAGVTSIDDFAFWGCTSLTSITVDANNPHYTGEGGVLYNKAKTALIAYPSASGAVTIPASVTSIGGGAFSFCGSLTGITIPAGVTSIGRLAFYGCTSLTEITIPAGVTEINDLAFDGCASLTNITLPASVTSIGRQAFLGCSSLTSITIPAGVTSIGSLAFAGCTSLTEITIPASVMFIGSFAFSGWGNTQTIYIEGHASDAAWDWSWDMGCDATIVYQGEN